VDRTQRVFDAQLMRKQAHDAGVVGTLAADDLDHAWILRLHAGPDEGGSRRTPPASEAKRVEDRTP
jgi:hypothetical protein